MKNVFWIAFETAVNLFQGFMLVFFPYSYLGDNRKQKFFGSTGVFYALILTAVISFMNTAILFEHFYALLYVGIDFIYIHRHLNGTLPKKIFAAVYPSTVMGAVTVLTTNLFAVLFDVSPEILMANKGTERFFCSIATQILIICAVMLSLKIVKKDGRKYSELAAAEWALISSVLLISIVICAVLNFISFEVISFKGRMYAAIAAVGLILINAVVYCLVIDLGKKNAAVRENEILKLKQEYSRQYVKNAAAEYEILQKLRHDFKDNYTVIYSLLSENKRDKGLEFIRSCIDTLDKTECIISTDNEIVNSVVNQKLSAAKALGIECSCLSIGNFDGIEDHDLCRLISNMLENAVTACMKSSSEHRRIDFKISFDGYNYTFNLKNTIDISVLENNPALKTTKADSKAHGLGTKIIRDTAEKYNGQCDFYEEHKLFCCNVTIPRK